MKIYERKKMKKDLQPNGEAAWNQEMEDSWKLTEKILFATLEGNEMLAMRYVEEFIEFDKDLFVRDELTIWKFFIVKMSVLLGFVAMEKGGNVQLVISMEKEFVNKADSAGEVTECHQMLRDMIHRYAGLGQVQMKKYSQLVQKIMAAVEMDLTAPLTLQYFAERLNVNGSYLSNLFRRETGQTITDYVTGKRIAHAANRLRYSREPIKMIARQAGIPDVQYFGRVFKKKMGVTPTRYRAQFADGQPED